MGNTAKKLKIASAIQIFFVIAGFIYETLFSRSVVDFLIVPVLICTTATFLFSVLFVKEMGFSGLMRSYWPASLAYILLIMTAATKVLIDDYSYEALAFTFVNLLTIYLPITIGLWLLNGFGGWLGSLLHNRLLISKTVS